MSSNAAAYLFSEFNRLHILESDLFIDDAKFEHRGKLAPDPTVKSAFENELSKSDAAANKILAQNPDDIECAVCAGACEWPAWRLHGAD